MSLGDLTPEQMAQTPGMAPPTGVVTNLDPPMTKVQIGLYITYGITGLFAALGVGLRYFQSIKVVKKLEMDLAIVTTSLGVSVYYMYTIGLLMDYGWGQHQWDVSVADLMKIQQNLLSNVLAYFIGASFTKFAILAVLYRIDPRTGYRYVAGGIGGFVFLYTLGICVTISAPCHPMKPESLKCIERTGMAQSAFNLAADAALICMPIPTIHRLNMSARQKVTIGCLLALGSAVTVSSIARLPYITSISNFEDTTYHQAVLVIWSIVEINLAIICACAMRLKPLVRAYLPKMGRWSPSAGSDGRENYGDKNGGSGGGGSGSGSRSTARAMYGPSAGRNGIKITSDRKANEGSYKLHSFQKSSNDTSAGDHDERESANGSGRDIHVQRSFHVDVECGEGRQETRGSSTDNMV